METGFRIIDSRIPLRFIRATIASQYGIEEMHQQIAVFHRAEQCLEYAIYLGVYAVFHGGLL